MGKVTIHGGNKKNIKLSDRYQTDGWHLKFRTLEVKTEVVDGWIV